MREVGFGVIGLGAVASVHLCGIENTDGAYLAAVADTDEERARTVAKSKRVPWYASYRELLDNPEVDVVCICTPTGLRGQITIDAARAGKHIIAEKPLEVSLGRIDALIEECDRAGVKTAVIFQNRFLDAIVELKKTVDEKRLGRLVLGDAYVKWHRSQQYYDSSSWRGTWAMDGGGALMNQGIHYVDLLQWLMGPVASVFAYAGTLARKVEVEDTAVACLHFASGAFGVIEACTAGYPGTPARLEIRGEKGTVIIEDGNVETWLVDSEMEYGAEVVDTGGGAMEPMAISPLGHQRQIADMLAAIRYDRQPLVDAREGRKAVEIITAIYRSARTGAEVGLPL